ncbi:transmembrane channel-like protein 1 [Neoarius graeffei]|uniref:transmembrane channel-like protein 1 n=1 Tax=Neoarius graeffei TaxID=443677 RepID=UPI00298D46AF|nr:transmembrane channel-like protein 1 [Neoarius graeffei]
MLLTHHWPITDWLGVLSFHTCARTCKSIFLIFLERTHIHTGTKLLRNTMPREKLITFKSDVSIDVDDGDKSGSIYSVEIDAAGRRQRQELDKKKRERKSKAEKGQVQRLQIKSDDHNGERKGIKRGGEVVETPKERNNSKNKRTKKQQEVAEKEEEEEKMKKIKQENIKEDDQSKKMKKDRKKATESIFDVFHGSEVSSSSDEEFAVGSLSEEELEKLMEAIDERKKLIATLRAQPWPMHKKMSMLRKSQAFIEKYEGTLGKSRGRKLYAYKVRITKKWVKFQKDFNNFKTACIPWEMKIKEIESHFGSSVASYFIFLRWMFGINIILFGLSFGLVMFPEALMGRPYGSIPRKTVPRQEQSSALDFDVIWNIGGYLKYSVLFYGYYNDQRTIGWLRFRMPLCYLLVGLGSVAYSYMVVIRTMARNASEESGGDDTNFNYSWKIFTSWDYLIGNPETADSKFASIATNFKEALVEEKESKKDENLHLKILFRLLANVLILSVLAGSGYLIYYVVHRSEKLLQNRMGKYSWWERNEVNVVMSLLSTFCPMLFDAISNLENYHPRITLRWQLGRVFALYVGNLYSFLIAVIDQINFTRAEEEEMKTNLTIWQANMYNRSIAENSTWSPLTVDPADVPRGPCWETMVGQEFVRMLISDTLTIYIVLLINDFTRSVVIRFLNHCWCWDLEYSFPCYAEFDLSGNVLNLIFNQGMIWMGTFYAPCLPALNLIKLQISMYIQAWAVMCCNVPHTRVFKVSRSSNFYIAILLVILFLSTLPTIFSIVSLRPSFDCGPFSGKSHMYDVILEMLQMDFPAWFGKVFSYISNPGLALPFLLLMVLTIYYLHATSKTYKQVNTDLKKKLQAQCKESRRRSKLVAKEKAEYMKLAESMAATEQQDKQSNNSVSGKDSRKSSRWSYYLPPPSPPPDIYSGGQGSGLKYSPRPPYTRPPAPRSHLMHGHLPGFPPY